VFAEVTKDKVQCFLNRISAVYSNIDSEIIHGNKIGLYVVLHARTHAPTHIRHVTVIIRYRRHHVIIIRYRTANLFQTRLPSNLNQGIIKRCINSPSLLLLCS